ncbi:MAG: dihydrolipoamide acetyltransferase family protein [Anaerolineae bacterium]
MAKEIVMPALGMAQETGVLLQWLKQPGDLVTKGEPLMEVETDKAAVEVEAPASGVLAQVTAGPGDVIPVGQVIAVILAPGETERRGGEEAGTRGGDAESIPSSPSALASSSPRLIASSPVAARMAAEHNLDLSLVKPAGGRIQKEDVVAYLSQKDEDGGMKDEFPPSAFILHPSKVLASPKARRLAKENGLELADLQGSGPEGAVLAADVEEAKRRRGESAKRRGDEEAFSASPPRLPASSPPQLLASLTMSRAWRIAAERLTQSWTTVPHFYLVREVNAGGLIAWREKVSARAAEKITYSDLLLKIVTSTLRRHPRLNAAWQDGRIILNEEVNVGLAVAIEDGLVVPVIQRADTLGLNDLAARRKELIAKAQAGKLSLADISGGTFTISNLGMYGVDAFNAIINPPQAAILAISRIAERVVPLHGQPTVQPMMTLTLSCDHRVVDGARGAQFLQTLAELVEEPLRLLD